MGAVFTSAWVALLSQAHRRSRSNPASRRVLIVLGLIFPKIPGLSEPSLDVARFTRVKYLGKPRLSPEKAGTWQSRLAETELDSLVLETYVLDKRDQPGLADLPDWCARLDLD